MDYCLLERFQGAWLGSILGEALANRQIDSTRDRIVHYQPVEWLKPREQVTKVLLDSSCQFPPLIAAVKEQNVARLALLLLPLIIFANGSLTSLKDLLTKYNLFKPNSVENLEDVLIWGYAIFLALTERLDLNNLIAQLSGGVGVEDNLLIKRLELVNQAVTQNMSLHEIETALRNRGNYGQVSIAMSLYSWAASPEDFALMFARLRATTSLDLTTMALSGALAGAYLGISGIPWLWRIWGQNNLPYQQAESTATELFNAWSGVYLPSSQGLKSVTLSIGGRIQPRANLKIISQWEQRESSR
jgi:hypothetical protein